MGESRLATDPAVVLQGVSKTYQLGDVAVPALKKITLQIPQKRFSMILGPSGSGKTTLLNLIGCLDYPSEGTLEVCGQNIQTLSDDQISEFRARNIAFIFQNFNLIPVLSAFENIEYPLILLNVPADERRERTHKMLKAVGLLAHAKHRPNQLSGGQRQRVAIARALIKGPGLVLADEPTANLDTKTGATIIDLMQQVQEQQGATFLFSTHDPQLVAHAQETFVILDGSVMEHHSHWRAQ